MSYIIALAYQFSIQASFFFSFLRHHYYAPLIPRIIGTVLADGARDHDGSLRLKEMQEHTEEIQKSGLKAVHKFQTR